MLISNTSKYTAAPETWLNNQEVGLSYKWHFQDVMLRNVCMYIHLLSYSEVFTYEDDFYKLKSEQKLLRDIN